LLHTRVKRLKELGLIEFEKETDRNAKHYKLTTKGLLHIVSNYTHYDSNLFIKYKDNIILQTLLYPYFEYETIKLEYERIQNCDSSGLNLLVSQYLRECCVITIDALVQGGPPRSVVYPIEVYNEAIKQSSRIEYLRAKPEAPTSVFNPYVKWIEEMLVWQAKSFAVKLSLKYIQRYPRVTFDERRYEDEDYLPSVYLRDRLSYFDSHYETTKCILSKDKRFMNLLKGVAEDFDLGYKDLLRLEAE
jgi:hypothetical protein